MPLPDRDRAEQDDGGLAMGQILAFRAVPLESGLLLIHRGMNEPGVARGNRKPATWRVGCFEA